MEAALDDRVRQIVVRLLLARLDHLHPADQTARRDVADDVGMPRLNVPQAGAAGFRPGGRRCR